MILIESFAFHNSILFWFSLWLLNFHIRITDGYHYYYIQMYFLLLQITDLLWFLFIMQKYVDLKQNFISRADSNSYGIGTE